VRADVTYRQPARVQGEDFWSNPTNRRWRLPTICGSKLPSRSRGASIAIFPWSVISVFGVVPFLVLPAPPDGSQCGS
jgi:hypothetical protein